MSIRRTRIFTLVIAVGVVAAAGIWFAAQNTAVTMRVGAVRSPEDNDDVRLAITFDPGIGAATVALHEVRANSSRNLSLKRIGKPFGGWGHNRSEIRIDRAVPGSITVNELSPVQIRRGTTACIATYDEQLAGGSGIAHVSITASVD
jgi:hypothetical protein